MGEEEWEGAEMGEALRAAAPAPAFPRQRIEERIEAAIMAGTAAAGLTARRRRWSRRLLVWGARTAAVLALLTVGTIFGRMTAPTVPAIGAAPGELLLDFTAPAGRGMAGTDEGLGLTLRCAECGLQLVAGEIQWTMPEWPEVQRVVSGGVAEEAGLLPGDQIVSVDGQDVRDALGTGPLAALPSRDFSIGFRRQGQLRTAFINRRIVNQTVIRDQVRVVVTNPQPTGLLGILDRLVRWVLK